MGKDQTTTPGSSVPYSYNGLYLERYNGLYLERLVPIQNKFLNVIQNTFGIKKVFLYPFRGEVFILGDKKEY